MEVIVLDWKWLKHSCAKQEGADQVLRAKWQDGSTVAAIALMPALLLGAPALAQAQGSNQNTTSPIVLQQPVVDLIDVNKVSAQTGKTNFTLDGVKLGDVSFTINAASGVFFNYGGQIEDNNAGYIVICSPSTGFPPYGSVYQCSAPTPGASIQVSHGQDHEIFGYGNGSYSTPSNNGSTFVDNGNGTCTWTKRDGTQIIYASYTTSGNPLCQSNNISKIVYPDGRTLTYNYYGSLSTAPINGQSPIVSIQSSSGYLLKYNYSSTPTFGGESSVTAINMAFENCDPTALACTLTHSWPTATLSWQIKNMSTSDNYYSLGNGYFPLRHYIFTFTDYNAKNHIFELDSYKRVISYQPPEATSPVYYYALCTRMSDGVTLTNCFGQTQYNWNQTPADPRATWIPQLWNLVNSATKNGQTWYYTFTFTTASYPHPSSWRHDFSQPLGGDMYALGNATPGTETAYGLAPLDQVSEYDGTFYQYEPYWRDYLSAMYTPLGKTTKYSYDSRGNLNNTTQYPISGSNLPNIVETATFPATCSSMVSCNKPTAVVDGNGNETDYTYDNNHGGVLTLTKPAVNGVRPQTRYTYVQRHAWYNSPSGSPVEDPNPVWLVASESTCLTSAAASSGSGCSAANDEIVTTYDYGPDAAPNNLLLRGKTVTWAGNVQRSCYGHDINGNKIWETSPNASPSACPAY
jgi:hypothetical protein